MRTWKIVTRFTPDYAASAQLSADEAAAPQEQHVTDALPDEAAVRAYVAANWPHLEFVSAKDVTPPSLAGVDIEPDIEPPSPRVS